MSSILKDKYIFYSYWDKDGHGINPEHLVTYSASPIFDHYNRTIYAYGGIFGPHYFGSYHGEIFNDYAGNIATGNYSSASGHGVVSYNDGEAGFGKYNISREEEKTIFTVGNGDEETHHNAFELWEDGSAYIPGTLYAGHVNAYTAHYDELDIDVTYIDELHVKTSYADVAYIESSYNEYTYSVYSDIDELHVKTSYADNAYIESSYNEYTYSTYADVDELHIKTSYTDVAYIGENAYAGNNLWVKRLDDDNSYTNAAYAFSRMVRMFPLSDPITEGFVNGKYYIWVGTTVELPREEDRYRNVIYIVLDDAPSTDLHVFDDDTNE